MKNIEFGPSGWRSFLGLVGAAALLAFSSVSAVVIDTFDDGIDPFLISPNGSICKNTPDGGNNMVGDLRELEVSANGGSVTVEVVNGVLSIGAGVGASATLEVIWDNTNEDGDDDTCALTHGGNFDLIAAGTETMLKLAVRADHDDSKVVVTIYSGGANSDIYKFDVVGDGSWHVMTKLLATPFGTTGDGADLAAVTAVTLTVENFVADLDIAVDLLATPVEVAGFDCNCSDDMANYSWHTTLEEDIASFLLGTCSEAGCQLLGEVAAQGTGFAYRASLARARASLAAAGDGDCAMAVIGADGELETDDNGIVVYSGSCD